MNKIRTRKSKLNQTQSQPERISLGDLIKPAGPIKNQYRSEAEMLLLSYTEPSGTKKDVPGRIYSGDAEILSTDNAEYMILTNSYIARGVRTNASALMRNGMECIPTNTADQKQLDVILQANDIDLIVYEIGQNCETYGKQFVETYIDKVTQAVRFELLPPPEMDYLRDTSQKVLYDKKTGRPQGYVQKRDGNVIAEWKGKDALRIAEFKYNTLGGSIDGIPGIQCALLPAAEYGYIRNSIADSFIRSLPVAHIQVDGATPEDIEDVTAGVNDRFTARTTYVTSERFTLNNSSPKNDIDVFKFAEPPLSEIAACFHMPIEMLASTQYLKSDDFIDRRKEWIEHIKVKQKIIASVFEHQIFSVIFTDPVKVRFNNPDTITTTDLIETVGFAVQSGAITSEQALEIFVKNQVFGPYTSSLEATKQTTESNKKDPEAVKSNKKPAEADKNVDNPTE